MKPWDEYPSAQTVFTRYSQQQLWAREVLQVNNPYSLWVNLISLITQFCPAKKYLWPFDNSFLAFPF